MSKSLEKIMQELTQNSNEVCFLYHKWIDLRNKSKEIFKNAIKICKIKVNDKVIYKDSIYYVLKIGYTNNYNEDARLLFHLTKLRTDGKMPKRSIRGDSARLEDIKLYSK